MKSTAKLAVSAFLLCCTTTSAGDTLDKMPELYEAEKFTWKHVDGYMSAREYRESSRYNRKVFERAAKRAFTESLTTFGISKQGAEITGAAVVFAIKGAELDLNESETLTLKLKDVVSEDPRVFFNFKLDW